MSSNTTHTIIIIILLVLIYAVYQLYCMLKKNQVDLESVGVIPVQSHQALQQQAIQQQAIQQAIQQQAFQQQADAQKKADQPTQEKGDEPEKVVYYYPQYPNPWLYPNRNIYYDSLYNYNCNPDLAGGYDLYSYNNPYSYRRRPRNENNISIHNNVRQESPIPKDVPKQEIPKADPKVDIPKVVPKVVPKVDVPKVVPKVDVPKVDVPKVDVPKVDVPKVDVPKVVPKVDVAQTK